MSFGVRQKQPKTVDEAVQHTLELESYLRPSRPGKVAQVSAEDDSETIAAASSRMDPMVRIMKRLDDLEAELKSVRHAPAPSRDRDQPREGRGRRERQERADSGPVVCHRCGKEGHFVRGCAARVKQMLVVDCLTTEVILGRDFLSRYKCTVDVGENLIHFKEKGVTMCLDCPPGGQQIARISVTLGTTLSVPPQSEIEVMATVSKSAVNGMWMIEGCHEEKLSVLIARSLVLPTREEVPIRLMNLRSECVTVKQGTVVAEMEAFQEEQSITTAAVQEDPLSQDSTSDAEVRKKLVSDMVTRDGAHLCDSEKKQLSELLLEFGDVLATGPEDFGRTSRISHRIHTADSHPIR